VSGAGRITCFRLGQVYLSTSGAVDQVLPDEDLLRVTQDALKAEKIYSPPDEPDPLHPLRVHRTGRPRLAQHELVGDAGGGMAGLIEIATDAVGRVVTDCDAPMPAHEPASTDAWKPVGGSSPVR
jgi:hypothetical protein